MLGFIGRRLISAVIVVLALTASTFVLQQLSHLDSVRAHLGPHASQEQIAQETRRQGLDQPLLIRYERYLTQLLHGDLARSTRTQRPVTTDLSEFLPPTLELASFGMLLALALGLALGIAVASPIPATNLMRHLLIGGSSLPPFLVALLAILAFAHVLHVLPTSGQSDLEAPVGPTRLLVVDSLLNLDLAAATDALRHLVLPSLCVALVPCVAIGRVLGSSLLETLATDHALAARARGLSEAAILLGHAMRNSIGAATSVSGLQLGAMLTGMVVVEDVFAWPGIGRYTADAISTDDFPALLGVTIVVGLAYVLINAIVDILQAAADPRLRLG